jgi:cation transport ATPase
MNGVKFYGSRDPDQIVSYAAALVTTAGGSLAPLFSQLLESRSGYHYDALNLQSYPGGVGGEVNDEAVLTGTLSFMQSMGVDMPKGTRVNQAVYVSIDGQLCGVFAISYNKVKSSSAGLTTLCAYRGLTPVMTAGDFMLTENYVRSKFGVNTRRMVFPDRE